MAFRSDLKICRSHALISGQFKDMLRSRKPFILLSQTRNASKIESVLVANRGEIALRIMRTARKLNIETIAVFSDADQNAQHKKFADKAFRIGEPSPLKSYLCGDRIIDVALKAGVQVTFIYFLILKMYLGNSSGLRILE